MRPTDTSALYIVCVQRTDNWAQQRVVNGKARFAAPRAASGTRVYGFSGVNSYGACTTKVAQLTCEMPQGSAQTVKP